MKAKLYVACSLFAGLLTGCDTDRVPRVEDAQQELQKAKDAAAQDLKKAKEEGDKKIQEAEKKLAEAVQVGERNISRARSALSDQDQSTASRSGTSQQPSRPAPQPQARQPVQQPPPETDETVSGATTGTEVSPDYCRGLEEGGISEEEREAYKACEKPQ